MPTTSHHPLLLLLLYYTINKITVLLLATLDWRYFSCFSINEDTIAGILLLLAQLNPKILIQNFPWVVVNGYKEGKVFKKLTNLERLSDLEIEKKI